MNLQPGFEIRLFHALMIRYAIGITRVKEFFRALNCVKGWRRIPNEECSSDLW